MSAATALRLLAGQRLAWCSCRRTAFLFRPDFQLFGRCDVCRTGAREYLQQLEFELTLERHSPDASLQFVPFPEPFYRHGTIFGRPVFFVDGFGEGTTI